MADYIYAKKNGKPTDVEKLTTTFKPNGRIESTREIVKFLIGFLDTDNLKDWIIDKLNTYTADFKGTFTSQADMEAVTGNKNDYCRLITYDQTGNEQYDLYKWVVGTGWVYEYTLKQDDFTEAEWAAIQSGITAALVAKLNRLREPIEVSDVTALTDEQCQGLKIGDTIIKVTGDSKHAYTVSYRNDEAGEMSIVYADHENIEEVYYEIRNDEWTYIQTDNYNFNAAIAAVIDTMELNEETGDITVSYDNGQPDNNEQQ